MKDHLFRVKVWKEGELWVAHCEDVDVVSQGNYAIEAIEAVKEAVQMVIYDDLSKGLNPLDRKPYTKKNRSCHSVVLQFTF